MAEKVYQRLAEDLEQRVRNGQYKPMSRLPPERELAAEFSVSRTTVREALMALEVANVITIKDRSGAYVLPLSEDRSSSLSSMKSSPGPHEVLQLRRLIEGEACFLVALNGSDAQIGDIEAAFLAYKAIPPNDTPEFHSATRAFHMSIVRNSENSLFLELLEFLWDQKSEPLWENWYGSTRSTRNRVTSLANASEIFDAIQARRAEAARTAMHRHIDWMVTRFLAY